MRALEKGARRRCVPSVHASVALVCARMFVREAGCVWIIHSCDAISCSWGTHRYYPGALPGARRHFSDSRDEIHTIMAPPIPRSTAYNSLRDASVAAALVGEQIDGQGVVAVEEDKLAEPEPGALHHERVV